MTFTSKSIQKNICVLALRKRPNPATLGIHLNITSLSNINVTNLGNFVRTRRRELRISQTELARRVGVDDGYISAIERGVRSPDGVVFIEQLGDALSLDENGKQELAIVATCSQRYIHLSDPLPVYKYRVIAALVRDPGLSEEDMDAIARVHAAIRRNRMAPIDVTSETSDGGAM
ncbi:helix-turn-helix domain-containing protein [Paraburkholderia fungorum]|uniref:helix-turn-helix domain-containing protein n=1 Tax=Paraburkholderia fungorum TaxID=134537 RepID=UPI00402B2606